MEHTTCTGDQSGTHKEPDSSKEHKTERDTSLKLTIEIDRQLGKDNFNK
jgi:hypothetical protein